MKRFVLAPLTAALLLLSAAPALAQDKAEEPVTSEPVEPAPDEQPFIDVLEYRGGDGDGVPEPGERLTVVIGIFNPTGEALNTVGGALESLTETVNVIKTDAGYGDIAVRQSASREFEIQIADNAETQPPCEEMPVDQVIVDDGTATKDGDAPVSDDGQTMIAPAPGETDAGAGSEPSYGEGEAEAEAREAEAGEGTVSSTEEGVVVPEEEPAGEPQQIEPVEPGSTEPGGAGGTDPDSGTEPGVIEPAPEPAQQDAPVLFKMILKVTASGQQYDLPIDNGAVCMYAMPLEGKPAAGAPTDGDDLAAGAERNAVEDGLPVGSRSAAPIAGVLLVAVGALVLRWAPSFGFRRFGYRRAMQ